MKLFSAILRGLGFVLLSFLAFWYCWMTKREIKQPVARNSHWTGILFAGMALFFGGIWYLGMILKSLFQ